MDLSQYRKIPSFLVLMLGLALGTTGCNEQAGTDKKTEKQGEVLATVNGEPITQTELNDYRSARPASGRMQNNEALLDELITQKIVYQDAVRQNLDKDPEVQQELELVRNRVLMSAAVRKAMENAPITDEELHAEYDKLKERMVAPEYKASHILVKEEEQAKKLIEQLNKGADFAKLAREHSTDPSSQNGGDLGWFNPQQMVPPFSQALVQLEKGSYTKQPVKTQFGWHIIKLEDQRQAEPPAFEEVKGRLENMLQQRQARTYIQGLKDKAKISITGKEEKKEPANAETKPSDTKKSEAPTDTKKNEEPATAKGESAEQEKADTSETK